MSTILFVHAPGGVPLDFAIPRMAAQGDLHMLSTVPLSDSSPWFSSVTSFTVMPAGLRGADLVAEIVVRARLIAADAVIAWSEYLLLATVAAAAHLGLRNAGPNASASRDKALMRETWREGSVPVPAFERVGTREQAAAAMQALRPPVLLKPSWGAGSVGQAVVRSAEEMLGAWDAMTATLASLASHGYGERLVENARLEFVAEEVIRGDSQVWFGDLNGVADYLSVEGVVRDGRYEPVAITGRLPWIGDFTEMGSFSPVPMSDDRIGEVLGAARAAVNALGLENCGTHTEIKLTDEGPVLIESAARLGGSAITEVVERTTGFDLVSMVTRILLGVDEPASSVQQHDSEAAVEMSLIGADATGTPWSAPRVWNPNALVDPALGLSAGTRVRAVDAMTVPAGSPISPFQPELGITNCAGMLLLTAADTETAIRDARRVFNRLAQVLAQHELRLPAEERARGYAAD